VRWVGAQRDMLAGDVSGTIDLATLAHLPHLYALGPREGLQGEVSIFDGRPSVSRVVDGRIDVDSSFQHRACSLAYATVPAWDETALAHAVPDVASFEERLLETATGRGTTEPFPFRVAGRAERWSPGWFGWSGPFDRDLRSPPEAASPQLVHHCPIGDERRL
jgi:acetolactate decarboxylase